MATPRKTVIFLGDGMADEPIPRLGSRTPLQYARTPAMDRIAREGRCGTLLTLPAGFPTSSEVANMSVLGCDLTTEYCGRGPLEAGDLLELLGRRVHSVDMDDPILEPVRPVEEVLDALPGRLEVEDRLPWP